jgi:hypothetical protein
MGIEPMTLPLSGGILYQRMLLLSLELKFFEPLMGIEPMTPSLPRKCSTPELQRHCNRLL